ncbi:MAG: hypothetical protein GTO54_01745, partial [Nitrososphaeria archaeon]|nr:hypothetical protein [Nitrososphaeria archaeon]
DVTLVPTFIDLVGEEHLSPELAKAIKAFDYDGTILFSAAYATNEKPRWVSQDWDSDSAKGWFYNYGAESLNDMQRMADSLARGEIPDP